MSSPVPDEDASRSDRVTVEAPSAVNLGHVQTVEKARLERWVGRLGPVTMRLVCRALAVAVGCEEV